MKLLKPPYKLPPRKPKENLRRELVLVLVGSRLVPELMSLEEAMELADDSSNCTVRVVYESDILAAHLNWKTLRHSLATQERAENAPPLENYKPLENEVRNEDPAITFSRPHRAQSPFRSLVRRVSARWIFGGIGAILGLFLLSDYFLASQYPSATVEFLPEAVRISNLGSEPFPAATATLLTDVPGEFYHFDLGMMTPQQSAIIAYNLFQRDGKSLENQTRGRRLLLSIPGKKPLEVER